ncbi:hypothetical protein SISSUDRAFT_68898 [Sistotremastrum suecicum HHB10207 ss-3]|uniref:Uncharacterized protein n=1 Tax=Sistotremastrum suecicum HHB10207 ss-3 TaxID=1314776 RepID=A0A166BIB0_9AGAM|nr:hypothetical protein SISSUDRAFT_68898 [Sistotremastrum suecicum HHB10207 ss-3]
MYTSTIIHLWYPLLRTAPWIDDASGVCLGVYGSIPAAITSDQKNPPQLQIITGQLGSTADLVIESITYPGSETLYLEVQASNKNGTPTFGIREWGQYGKGFVQYPNNGITTATRDVTIQAAGTTCGLKLHWQGTTGTSPYFRGQQCWNGDRLLRHLRESHCQRCEVLLFLHLDVRRRL